MLGIFLLASCWVKYYVVNGLNQFQLHNTFDEEAGKKFLVWENISVLAFSPKIVYSQRSADVATLLPQSPRSFLSQACNV